MELGCALLSVGVVPTRTPQHSKAAKQIPHGLESHKVGNKLRVEVDTNFIVPDYKVLLPYAVMHVPSRAVYPCDG